MEKETLLHQHDHDSDEVDDIRRQIPNGVFSNFHGRPWIFAHLMLGLILFVAAFVGLCFISYGGVFHSSSTQTSSIWKPFFVDSVISVEHATGHQQSIYSGEPNEENTMAWERLIDPTFIAASASELRAANESIQDSVQLVDTDGYLAALGVYHELHCLRRLRLYLFRDYYFDNLTEANMDWFRHHLDHCIETLRISIMCSADLSLYTFRWQNTEDLRPETKTNARRQCANWDEVETWSSKRSVGLSPRLWKGAKKDETPL